MFIDNFMRLCENKGISPTSALAELGISHGVYGNWKKGGTPTNPTKMKLAQYFNIAIADLMSENIEKPATNKGDELLTKDELEFLTMYRRLSPERKDMVEVLAKMLHSEQ